MKNIKDYITEAREVVGELPFSLEEFATFMNEAIINAGYECSNSWKNLEEKFCSKYPNKLWRVFTSLCEQYLELKGISIEEFYNGFKKIPLDRIKKVLGAGSNGVVIEINDNKVIKLYYGTNIKKCDLPFIKYCLNLKSKVFPTVYKMSRNWCIMELLETHTDKCKLYMDTLDEKLFKGKSLIGLMSDAKYNFDKIDTSKFTDIQKEVFEWCREINNEMMNINSPYINFPGDLVLNNIGERKNGDVVFFDI